MARVTANTDHTVTKDEGLKEINYKNIYSNDMHRILTKILNLFLVSWDLKTGILLKTQHIPFHG